jgi:3-hydroxyisobutyrate dehydrogenase-like beta-hydroxyacid dehydrogenase
MQDPAREVDGGAHRPGYNVTIIGAGRMGSALATALFHKGFATTVWNRTVSKTKDLSKLGLRIARNAEEAVREADLVVVSVSDYSSTQQLLRQPGVEDALRGKIVVQLSSGTPKEAREMDSWARRCGISYLDGAILGSPEWIGTSACTIFYSGPAEVFEHAKPVLMVFGDRTLFVGHEIGHASAIPQMSAALVVVLLRPFVLYLKSAGMSRGN